jgi:outer membrane protein OmpA-like peptidoglycan-associated protein
MLIKSIKAICLIACFAILSGLAAAQATAPNITNVPDGQKISVFGIITNRAEESFVMTTQDRTANYVVNLMPDTSVKTFDAGVFRGGHRYATSFLLRGLQVKIEGRGNANGAINATDVRFKEVDLRAAQSLNTILAPVESQVASNTDRIGANEANDQRQAGQIEENAALTAKAQSSADNAMTAAEKAQLTADRANNRINGLDEYDPIKTINVPFATGKYTLSTKAKAIIDEAAAWVKTQNTKGWMVSVVGFADSTGKTAANKTLSERRADTVINYLVTTYNLPLTKLVQPFGAGINSPVATNDTAEGRAQNRRVEIRLLLNKGIAGN